MAVKPVSARFISVWATRGRACAVAWWISSVVKNQPGGSRHFQLIDLPSPKVLCLSPLPVARIQIGFASKDKAVLRTKDGNKVVVVLHEQPFPGKGVLALARSALIIVLGLPGAFIKDTCARLHPEANPVRAGLARDEGLTIIDHRPLPVPRISLQYHIPPSTRRRFPIETNRRRPE